MPVDLLDDVGTLTNDEEWWSDSNSLITSWLNAQNSQSFDVFLQPKATF